MIFQKVEFIAIMKLY